MLARFINFFVEVYSLIIFVYILMSWIPGARSGYGTLAQVYDSLGRISEPYLSLFRRFIPPVGMIDFSPIVALLVLQFGGNLIIRLLYMF